MSIDGTQLTLPKWLEPVRKDQYIYIPVVYMQEKDYVCL
jgi:hypothetical protein